MRRWLLAAITTTVMACASEPTDVELSGEWTANVNALGIVSLTMTITEDASTLTATGQWIPMGESAPRTFTASGLHFVTGLNMVFTFATSTGPAVFTTQGQTEGSDSFYLLFPVADTPARVNFTRR